jgi:PadR family transcriptional regulator PadR
MSVETQLLKGNSPTLVLAVLRDGPLHGYGIAREIERRSEDALRCKEGTLYQVLHSLERDGLIRGEWRGHEGDRQRKVYALTPAGEASLEERTRTWNRFSAAVGRVLTGGRDGRTAAPEPGGGGLPHSGRAEPEPA